MGGFVSLLERLAPMQDDMFTLGIALHPLRAVPEDAMRALLATGIARGLPVHIHIAEQIGEVQDCLAVRGARPVEWLLDHADIDPRWTLVHATHLTAHETDRLAKSGAVAGLCPTTEANLGDGLFPPAAFIDAGGTFGIGSDSTHIGVAGGGTSLARIRAAPAPAAPQRRGTTSRGKRGDGSGAARCTAHARAAGVDVGRCLRVRAPTCSSLDDHLAMARGARGGGRPGQVSCSRGTRPGA